MIGILLELEPVGPISVNLPLISRSGGAFYLPPPTTLVGALAFPYMKSENCQVEIVKLNKEPYSSAVLLVDKIAYACAGTSFYVYTRQLERVSTIIYQKDVRRRELENVARGKPVKNKKEFETALRLAYGVASRSTIIADKMFLFYLLKDEKLVKCAYGVNRLGTKESRVIVRKVSVYDDLKDLVVEEPVVKTVFYVRKDLVLESNGIEVRMPIIDKDNFKITTQLKTEAFIVPSPYSIGPMSVTIDDSKANVLYLREDGLKVVVPKNLVEGV